MGFGLYYPIKKGHDISIRMFYHIKSQFTVTVDQLYQIGLDKFIKHLRG